MHKRVPIEAERVQMAQNAAFFGYKSYEGL
jgi:hypothetical protein